jgi:ParB family chromosome partitioning protein
MGKRIDLSQLANQAVLDAPVPQLLEIPARLTQVPVRAVAANPVNPRETMGDLSDLESMRTVGQLQPCAVVTRNAFLAIYPDHVAQIGASDYVVVAGSRRRLAAEQFGMATLDIVVRDVLATDRATFYGASVSENIDRRNFDVLEEARAVQRLAEECGSGTRAGEILGKTKGWVSQRLALLRLSAEMRALLRSGELPIRDARRLAQLPESEQLPAWEAERVFTAVNGQGSGKPAPVRVDPGDDGSSAEHQGGRGANHVPATRIPADATADQIADILDGRLTDDELNQLIAILTRAAMARTERLPR